MPIIAHCAACAAELVETAPRCVRCHTRYCDAACQHEHWANGHKKKCKRIARAGGAEPYHADLKFKEAAAQAVERCAAELPADAICYVCRCDASTEGLVRGCACRGTAGLVHMSCLTKKAKFEAEDSLGRAGTVGSWMGCGLCDGSWYGPVMIAMGWACWKTYMSRPDHDGCHGAAMLFLTHCLGEGREALPVVKAYVASLQRVVDSTLHYNPLDLQPLRVAQKKLAECYFGSGQPDEALRLMRSVYTDGLRIFGPSSEDTFNAAEQLAGFLIRASDEGFFEAKTLLRKHLPSARRTLAPDAEARIKLAKMYAVTIYIHADQSDTCRDDRFEAVSILEKIVRVQRRKKGPNHPSTKHTQSILDEFRQKNARCYP